MNTSISPMLSVRRGSAAIDFYRSAFGALVLYRIDDPSGAVVARLAVKATEFWVVDNRTAGASGGADPHTGITGKSASR